MLEYVCQLQTTMSVCFSIGLQCMYGGQVVYLCVYVCVCLLDTWCDK